MLRDKKIYKGTVFNPVTLGASHDITIGRRRIKATAMIHASVVLDILSSIVGFKNNLSEFWMYLRTLYESNNAHRRLMLIEKLAIFKLRAPTLKIQLATMSIDLRIVI